MVIDLPEPEDTPDHRVRAGNEVPCNLIARGFGFAMPRKLEQEHARQDMQGICGLPVLLK